MDEHLDTSWCPVCDKLILPKRFTVPADPPPRLISPSRPPTAPPALTRQASGRGKPGGNANTHLKALARNHTGGLLHGTGRIRPGGGLKRNASTSNMVPTLQQQQQQIQLASASALPARERTVIDQAQTPLYCSDECMKADLELANIPLSRSAPTDSPFGMHPSQLNPALASPPPQSPTLRSVPHTLLHGVPFSQATQAGLHQTLSEAENSDSSSNATGSGTTSDCSARHAIQTSLQIGQEATVMLPPVSGENKDNLQSVSARLQNLLVLDSMTNRSKGPRVYNAQPVSSPTLTTKSPNTSPSHSNPKSPVSPTSPSAQARAKNAIELYSKYPLFSKSRSTSRSESRQSSNLAAMPTVSGSFTEAYAMSASTPASLMRTDAYKAASPSQEVLVESKSPASPPMEDQQCATTGLMNLSKLYAGRKLSTRHTEPRNILAKGAEGRLLVPNVKLKPLDLDVGLEYGSAPTNLASPVSMGWPLGGGGNSSDVNKAGNAAMAKAIQREGRSKGGRLANMRSMALRRDASDPGVRRDSVLTPLGSVTEEGAWHETNERGGGEKEKKLQRQGSGSTQDAESEDEGCHETKDREGLRRDASASLSRRGSRKGSETGGKGREGLKLHERGRLNMQARTWSYDNLDIPTYEPMPAIPIRQIRLEEVFVPDVQSAIVPLPTSLNQSANVNAQPADNGILLPASSNLPHPPSTNYTYVDISPLHIHDTELSRRPLRDIGIRPGTHEGRAGWWIEKEWEVIAIPERKRLFLFGSGIRPKTTTNTNFRLNA